VIQNEAVARPYANAIFELAQGDGNFDAWTSLLTTAGQVVSSEDLTRLLDSPRVDRDRVVEMIADICTQDSQAESLLNGQGRNLLRLLAENHRLTAIPAIAAVFEKLRAEVENTLDVTLTAATQVDEAQQATMAAALKKRFGRDVRLHFVLDETLLGGARLQAEDHVIDGSVRTRLEKLASALVH
jgi:F-type H+-transporting ATPase subunit delta